MKTINENLLYKLTKPALIKTIKELYIEIEYLKEDFIPKLQWSKNRLDKDNYELQKRIDKATAYINQLEHSDWVSFGRTILLDILQGNKEE